MLGHTRRQAPQGAREHAQPVRRMFASRHRRPPECRNDHL